MPSVAGADSVSVARYGDIGDGRARGDDERRGNASLIGFRKFDERVFRSRDAGERGGRMGSGAGETGDA